MKTYVWSLHIFMLLLFASSALSATKYLYPDNPADAGIIYYQWSDGYEWHIAYQSDNTHHLGGDEGYWPSPDIRYEKWRSAWEFIISDIPDGSTINSVRIHGIIFGDDIYYGKLVKLDWDIIDMPETRFEAIGSSQTVYLSHMNYMYTYNQESTALKDEIQNNLPVDKIIVGLICPEEYIDGTYGTINDFYLAVDYTPPGPEILGITVSNRRVGGSVKVDNGTFPSGAPFNFEKGSPHDFESWDQNYGGYDMIFKSEGPKWLTPDGPFTSALISQHSVQNSGTYEAQLWRRCNYTASNNFFEGGSGGFMKINGITLPIQLTGTTLEADPITFEAINQNRSVNGRIVNYVFSSWENGTSNNPRTIIPDQHFTVTANYKGLQVSNNSDAFSKNGQRRLIETKTGTNTIWLHQVYTSNDHIWIEHSSDGGNSWILGNGGRPLDTGTAAKNPSIAYVYDSMNNYNYIGVVWQEKYSSRYKIMGKIFNQAAGLYNVPSAYPAVTTLHTEYSDQYTVNANPNLVMSGGVQGPYLMVFERKGASGGFVGLNWRVGHIEDSGHIYDGPFGLVEEGGFVSGTNANTTNAQLSVDEYGTISANLIYQTGTSTGAIYCPYLHFNYNGDYWDYYQYDYPMISYPILNFNPSVVTLPDYFYASCWIEYEQLVFHRFNESVLHYYDSLVRSASINRGGNTNGGFVVWSRQNYSGTWYNKSMRFDNGSPVGGSTRTLNISGKYLQVGNGANTDLSNMYVSSFYPFSSPYYFKTSTALAPLSKAASNMVTGRGFMLQNGDATFSYRLEGLNVDGKNINFVDVPDTTNFGNLDILNNALLTEPFELNANSEVVFSERSGFADSVSAGKVIGKKEYIRYKVDLIDDATGKVIGTIKNKKLDAGHTPVFEAKSFQLDTKGLTAKSVRAKITLETNCIREISPKVTGNAEIPPGINPARINAKRSNLLLTKSFMEENEALDKSVAQQLATVEINLPVRYSLKQNYPNPFNPVTQIQYNLAKDCEVSIMVYNVRGQKVTELINGFKPAGSYTATFDGTGLASGIYFYKIKAGEFTDVKRMLLVK